MWTFIMIISIIAIFSILAGTGGPFVGFFGAGVAIIFWLFFLLLATILRNGTKEKKNDKDGKGAAKR